jgi:hypothetical protein
MVLTIKDDCMRHDDNPSVRKGKFLFMEASAQEHFVQKLTSRIAEGYYTSDRVLSRIVDELGPVFNELAENERA